MASASAAVKPYMSPLPRKSQRGMPVVLDANGEAATLKPFPLETMGGKSEAWLQGLVHKYPTLLSVDTIEPGLGTLLPIAMEVPCAHGFIDNIFLTRAGEIVLVEAKLWSNPQARREVVSQVLDYVAALQAMSYEAFEAVILKTCDHVVASLYDLIPSPWLAEADFVDAVTRNLTRGRVLAIVLGNGIREEVRTLAGFLQGHAGSHFTLALVQINLWADPEHGTLVAVPDTLAQTVMIERGIVVIDDGIPKVVPMPVSAAVATGKTMSSELFDEALAKIDPNLPAMLRGFVSQGAPLGVITDQKATLHLLAQVPGYAVPLKLGYIAKNGQYWTENVTTPAVPSSGEPPTAEVTQAAIDYLQSLAQAIGGSVTDGSTPNLTINGKSAPNVRDLLRDHADAWFEAIARYIAACEDAAKGRGA